MKSRTVQPQLGWTPWIVQGTPSAKMTAHDCQQYFGWELAHSVRDEPASSRRHHSMTRSDVEMRFEAGHPPRRKKRGGEASGMVFRRRFSGEIEHGSDGESD